MSIDLFTVYSYGGGDALFYVFNAVSMLFRSSLITSLINLSLALGLLWAGVKSAIDRDHHRPYVRWFMTYLFITIVLIPHNGGMTLHIRDTIAGPAKKVEPLPPGLVIPAAFISNIGYTLTKNFETVFAMPDKNYLSYHEYGTMFGAEVMSELENFRVQDPVLRENLESYINNCIMYDVMIGHSYDISDLKNSQNILELIENNASSIRMFNYRLPNKNGRTLKTCKAGIAEISSSLNNEHSALSLKFPFLSAERTLGVSPTNPSPSDSSATSTTTSSSPQVNTGILNALSATLGFYGNKQTAESQLNQIFLINAFKLHPNSYGTVRAAQNQNTAWKLSGEMAKQTLPIIHVLFQALIYATFPIIICLMFFPGGFRALLSYFGMMIWIELWPILFAILNLIISAFASRYPIDITIQNLDSIVSSQSNYALAAASLGMLVPVLSYMIVKGGAGQFVHIAGSLTGATMQGVGVATQEVTSGNRSLDNISMGNKSQNIVSANKFDTSPYIDTMGHVKEKLPDGTFQIDTSGKRIYQGEGASSGKTSINIGKTIKDSAQEAYHKQIGKAETLYEEYGQTVQKFDRQTVDLLSTMAEGRAEGKNYSIDTSTESGKSLTNVLNKAHELHEEHKYSWQQAVEGALEIGVGGGKGGSGGISLGISVAGIGLTLGLSGGLNIGASARASAGKTDTQSVGEGSSVIDDKRIEDHQALVKKWTESVNFAETDTKETRLVGGLSNTFETAKSQRKSLTESLSRASHFQDMVTRFDETSAGYTTNKYDDVLNYIADRQDPKLPTVKIGHKKARDIIEAGGKDLAQYMTDYTNSLYPNNLLKQKRAELTNQTNFNVEDTKRELKPEDTTAQFKAEQQEKHFKNFNVDGTDIKNEVKDQQAKTTQNIEKQEAGIKKEELRLRKEVDKADHSKSVIGRAFAKENPNVSPDDSTWPELVDLGLSALSLTPLGAGSRGMKVVNKLLPGVGKQVIKKLPGLSKKLPGLSNFKKLPKPKNE